MWLLPQRVPGTAEDELADDAFLMMRS